MVCCTNTTTHYRCTMITAHMTSMGYTNLFVHLEASEHPSSDEIIHILWLVGFVQFKTNFGDYSLVVAVGFQTNPCL